MSKLLKSAAAVAILSTLAACGGGNYAPEGLYNLVDFNQGIAGWVGGASDHVAGAEPSALKFEQRDLAAPLTGKGFYIAGRNHSDDMTLFVKKQFTGLEKNTSYTVSYTLKIASSVPSNCPGAGGSLGEAVNIYAAVSAVEPKTMISNNRVTLDVPRAEHVNLGNIGNGLACGTNTLTSKTLRGTRALPVKSDGQGAIWALIAIDSGVLPQSEVILQSLDISAMATKQ